MDPVHEALTSHRARRALAQRDITTVYRLLNDAGVAQRRIAELTGQSQPEVCEILKGRRVMACAGAHRECIQCAARVDGPCLR